MLTSKLSSSYKPALRGLRESHNCSTISIHGDSGSATVDGCRGCPDTAKIHVWLSDTPTILVYLVTCNWLLNCTSGIFRSFYCFYCTLSVTNVTTDFYFLVYSYVFVCKPFRRRCYHSSKAYSSPQNAPKPFGGLALRSLNHA